MRTTEKNKLYSLTGVLKTFADASFSGRVLNARKISITLSLAVPVKNNIGLFVKMTCYSQRKLVVFIVRLAVRIYMYKLICDRLTVTHTGYPREFDSIKAYFTDLINRKKNKKQNKENNTPTPPPLTGDR